MFYPQCEHHPRHGSQADSGDDEGRQSIHVGVWKKFDLGMHALFSSMVLDVLTSNSAVMSFLNQAARARGVDCIVAPYEADAQLAYLTKCHLAQAVITEDSDLLAFGCKKVRHRASSASELHTSPTAGGNDKP